MQLGHASHKRIAQPKITAFPSLSTEASTVITDIVLMMMMPMDGDGIRTSQLQIFIKRKKQLLKLRPSYTCEFIVINTLISLMDWTRVYMGSA